MTTEHSCGGAGDPTCAACWMHAFDTRLAAHDAEVRAEAPVQGFREGVNFIDNDPSLSWGGSMVAGRNEAVRREAEIERREKR